MCEVGASEIKSERVFMCFVGETVLTVTWIGVLVSIVSSSIKLFRQVVIFYITVLFFKLGK